MLDKLKDGYVTLHNKHGGQVFLRKQGQNLFSVNLDGVDPSGYESAVDVDLTCYCLGENISDDRFHWLREQANTRAHINKLTSLLQFAQLKQQAEQAGIIQVNQPANPQHSPQPENRNGAIVEVPGGSGGPAPIAPKMVDDNPGAPASSPENDEGYEDGAIVEVPPPSQRS